MTEKRKVDESRKVPDKEMARRLYESTEFNHVMDFMQKKIENQKKDLAALLVDGNVEEAKSCANRTIYWQEFKDIMINSLKTST